MKYLFFLLFSFSMLYSQQVLTLEDAIAISFDKSYDMKTSKSSYEISKLQLDAARLSLYTTVDLSFQLPNYSSALVKRFNSTTKLDEYYRIEENQISAKININQPILFTNGNLAIIGSLDQSKYFNSLKNKDYFTNLYLFFRQPLFSFNNQAAQLRRTEIAELNSNRDFTSAEFDIVYRVTESFFNLFKLKKQVEIKTIEVKQKELSYETSMNKFKAGMIAEVEVLKLEVELAQSKNSLLDFLNNFEEQKNNFKHLIGMDLVENIDITAELDFINVDIDQNEMLKLALKNRPDLLKAETQIENDELSIDEVSARRRINLELNASYGLNKNDEIFDNLFKDLFETRKVSLDLKVPVWDWGSHSKRVQAEKIKLNQSQDRLSNLKKTIEKEIRLSVNRINSAKSRVEVLTKSVAVAEKSYEISIERFNVGKINSFELSQIQLNLTQTKLESLDAIIQYKLAIADLERKTLSKLQ